MAPINMEEIRAQDTFEKAFSGSVECLSYDNICTIMFLIPEVAAVGMNESDCIKKNIPIKVVKPRLFDYLSNNYNAKDRRLFQHNRYK